MEMTKKFIMVVFCLCLLAVGCFTANAETIPLITISNKTALPGEEVTIDISISNNPGIMAMAFCITYDSDALEYTGYTKGYLSKYTVKNHSDKGHIAFVNDESSDKSNNGIILSVKFKTKNDAAPKKYKITLANLDRKKYGNKLYKSFSNSNLKNIEPTIKSGSITILETCENSGHKFGSWKVITPANCINTGLQRHSCIRCNFSEEVVIPITHDFEDEWTIDKAATPEEDGIMSRHCKKCDEATDKITFSYEEIGGDDTDDTSSDEELSTPESSNTSSDNSVITDNSSITDSTKAPQDSSNKPTNTQKPSIDNVIGEKIPQQEAQKLENYPGAIKPNPDNSNTLSENSSKQETSSNLITNDSDIIIDNTRDNESSFFETTTGIIMIVVCSILSIGIIVFGIILIIKNKRQ